MTTQTLYKMDEYRTLGRTGLKVSPLGLGVMTYGWGADKQAGRGMFDLYRECDGNFFDTADMYSAGESETWLGEFVHETRSRDEVVISTKFSFNARAQTLAEDLHYELLALLQLEYPLVSRSLEREHVPLAAETDISIVPGSPLVSGCLTGKYRRVNGKIEGSGRVFEYKDSGNPTLEKFAKLERNWRVLDALLEIAKQLGRTPTEVALAWVMGRPRVTSVLIGATRPEQLELNLSALDLDLPAEAERRRTETSRPESTELDHFFEPTMQRMIHGGVHVRRGPS